MELPANTVKHLEEYQRLFDCSKEIIKQDAKTRGALGENLVSNLMTSKGYILLENNFVTPYGEIDLILKRKSERERTCYLVEVKTVSQLYFEDVFERWKKMQKRRLIKSGYFFIDKMKWASFVLVFVIVSPSGVNLYFEEI